MLCNNVESFYAVTNLADLANLRLASCCENYRQYCVEPSKGDACSCTIVGEASCPSLFPILMYIQITIKSIQKKKNATN